MGVHGLGLLVVTGNKEEEMAALLTLQKSGGSCQVKRCNKLILFRSDSSDSESTHSSTNCKALNTNRFHCTFLAEQFLYL